MPMVERPRLTLEDYILFFTTRTGHGINVDHLNQIVFMHGFIKLHHSNKHVIVDALNSFDLLRPRRSTVSINAVAPPPGVAAASASAAALSTEDVARDIEDLGWRECPVGSLLSFRAGAAASSPVPLATILPGSSGTVERISPPSILSTSSPMPPAAPAVAEKRKRGVSRAQGKAAIRKRRNHMLQLLTLPSLEVEDMATAA